MTQRGRLILFAVASACILAGLVQVMQHMPVFGAHPLP